MAKTRVRRGKVVEIPEEWVGKTLHRQTRQKRQSKLTRKQRNAQGNTRTLQHGRRARIEGRAPRIEDE